MSGPAPPAAPPAAPRRLLAVLVATLFVRFGFGLTVSVFASYIIGRSAGIDAGSVGLVGLIGALAPIGEFSTVLLSGVVADRYGRVPVLLAGTAVAAGLLALVSGTRQVEVLGAINLLFGVASGAILAASLAVVADEAAPDRRGREMGFFDAVNLLGWILGFAIGFGLLGLLPNAQLPWVFRLGAGLLVIGFVAAARLVRGTTEPTSPGILQWARLRAAVFRRDVLLVTLPWLVIYMLIGTGFTFLGAASTGAGLSTTTLALIIGGGGLLLLATQPYFGHLSDRFGRMRLMGVGTVGFVGVLVGAALLANFGPNPLLLAAVGISVLVALAYGPAALAALAELSESISRATTMAIYTLVISLGMIVGLVASTALFSALGNLGLDLFFGAVGILLVTLTLLRYQDVRTGRAIRGT